MKYVYACEDARHPRSEIAHSIEEEPQIVCGVCGAEMHRVPQSFRWYRNPGQVLLEKLDDGYRNMRARRSKK